MDAKASSESRAVDARMEAWGGWRGEMLSRLRDLIKRVDEAVVEDLKWKKPSNPMGVPVWSHDGIICVGEALKSAVRLTFPKGARINDPVGLFNTRLDSRTVRAIDFREGDTIDEVGLKTIVLDAVRLNQAKPAKG